MTARKQPRAGLFETEGRTMGANEDSQRLHQEEYATSDFERQVWIQAQGLRLTEYEEKFVDKYFSSNQPTLEVGTGGGRIAFAMARKGFRNLVAIDFIKGFIDICQVHAKENSLDIDFRVGNALNLEFADSSFAQVIAGGVLWSHFPGREYRQRVLSEMYRVLQPGGVLIINAHNIYRNRYLQLIKRFMQFVRLFGNPHNYEETDLPRLGGKNRSIDFLFFRKTKSTLHYFHPVEFLFELLSMGFLIQDCNFVHADEKPYGERYLFNNQPWLMAVCHKPTSRNATQESDHAHLRPSAIR